MVVRLENGSKPRRAGLAGDDGLVDPVDGVVRELDEQQELRERVVLAGQALSEPSLRDRQHLRKQPALDFGHEAMHGLLLRPGLPVVSEVLLQRQFG